MEKKYVLTDEVIDFYGHALHRIEAVRDFGKVKAGDKGGFIECEDNLSHEGNAWVCDDAKVCQSAVVKDNAIVWDNAVVMDRASVRGNARVGGRTQISENAVIYQDACIICDSSVSGSARVGFKAYIENAKISGRARVLGVASIKEQNQVLCFENILGDVLTFWRGRFGIIQAHSLKYGTVQELKTFKRRIRHNFKGKEKKVLLKACEMARLQIEGI